jgi:hypothetical protein
VAAVTRYRIWHRKTGRYAGMGSTSHWTESAAHAASFDFHSVAVLYAIQTLGLDSTDYIIEAC